MQKTDAAITNLTTAVDGVISALTAANAAASSANGQLATIDDSASAAIQAQTDRLSAAIAPADPSVQP